MNIAGLFGLGQFGGQSGYQNMQNPYGLGSIGGQFPTPLQSMEAMFNMQKDYMKKTAWYLFKGVPDMSKWSLGARILMARNIL